MRFYLLTFFLLINTTTSINSMLITGDKFTTQKGSITIDELITLSRNYKILRLTTLAIIGYLIYEKIYKSNTEKNTKAIES